MKRIIVLLSLTLELSVKAQFAPPAGQMGTTAIHMDSSAFIAWASGCSVVQEYQDISNPNAGYANVGDNTMAIGIAGANGTVSLGDGGNAILTFPVPIINGPGADFAVFENSFSDDFLELAFVEVSSDAINFFRFPAVSNTQDDVQMGSFDLIDATKLNNLAGKYRYGYGTPFDLQELSGTIGLNINAITHVRIIDVVGNINPLYATYDSQGNKVNDPWPTPFGSSGFDLDAVGVIHAAPIGIEEKNESVLFSVFPNPASSYLSVQLNTTNASFINLKNSMGESVISVDNVKGKYDMDLSDFAKGVYFLEVRCNNAKSIKKIIVQ